MDSPPQFPIHQLCCKDFQQLWECFVQGAVSNPYHTIILLLMSIQMSVQWFNILRADMKFTVLRFPFLHSLKMPQRFPSAMEISGQGAVSSPCNLSMVLLLNIQKFIEWFNMLGKDMKSKCVDSTSRSSIHQDAANRSISYGNLSVQGALSSSTQIYRTFFFCEDSELGCLVGGFQVFLLWATSRWAIQAKD